MQLDGGHVYDRAVLIDEGTLLVLASGFFGRETFLVDLAGGRVSALDVPADDVAKLLESVIDSLRSMGLPLWTVGRTRNGDVLVKHLFEDIVYRYDSREAHRCIRWRTPHLPAESLQQIRTGPASYERTFWK